MLLSQEDYESIEELAACNYTKKEIALFLGVSFADFLQEYERLDSQVKLSIKKGKLVADFEINQKLLINAKAGNITAAQIYEKNKESKNVEELKNRILYNR